MKRIAQIFVWIALAIGTFLIGQASLVYFNPDEFAPFVIEKLPLKHEDLFMFALQAHVIAAVISLPGCLILTSKEVLKRLPRFHRWFGRFIGTITLGMLVPSGIYLAFFARGGIWGTIGFLVSAAIVLFAMVQAIRTARRKQYTKHRRLTFHVFGQLSVAVSSRVMLHFFDKYSKLDPDLAYLISLWIPVIGTVLLIEFLLRKPLSTSRLKGASYEKNPDPRHPLYPRNADL